MNEVFSIPAPFQVPDGTWVSPFLNAKDSQSALPFGLLDGFSIAAGRVDPYTSSKVHVMPFVTQVTFVRRGILAVRMQGPTDAEPYTRRLTAEQAVLTEPGVAFQLINESAERCEVLYVVSPAYVVDKDPSGAVVYDDSVILAQGWNSVRDQGWRMGAMPTAQQRAEALRSLSERKATAAPKTAP